MKRKLLILPRVEEDLKKLIDSDPKVLSFLGDTFSKNYLISFEYLVQATPEDLIDKIETLYDYYCVIGYLRSQQEEFGLDVEGLIENFKMYFKEIDSKIHDKLDKEDIKNNFLKIFNPSEEQQILGKIGRISKGILDNCTGFQSYCEIRPVFNLEKTAIVKNVPIIITNIQVSNDEGETKSYVFQMNEEVLHRFKEFLEITSKKLEIVKETINKIEKTNE